MRFSIIIPVYNVETYLRDCLDSVCNQSFTDWEAVCVNDGSTDGSFAFLEEFATKESRFRIISQPNGGLSAARNTGLMAARGEYVLFLDSDDWLEPNALEILASNLSDEDMLCFSGRRYFEAENAFQEPDRLICCKYLSGMDYYNDNALARRDFAFVCVVLRAYRRSFLLDNDLLFEVGIFHEDNLFTPKACFFARRVKVLDKCLYDYRVRENSITTTVSPKRLFDLMETANDLAAFFSPRTGFNKTIIYRSITHHYQVVFAKVSRPDRKVMRQRCNWRLYYEVSRSKFRHRINYLRNRLGL